MTPSRCPPTQKKCPLHLPVFPHPFPVSRHPPSPLIRTPIAHHAQEVSNSSFLEFAFGDPIADVTHLVFSSGIARFAAGRRVGVASFRSASKANGNVFKPYRPALPVYGARYMATAAPAAPSTASTDPSRVGKIYQVIGAVVDVVCAERFTPGTTFLSQVLCGGPVD